MFTGEQRDADSGFYYLRARYYDPFLGRFITRDPLGEGNGYSYVLNNPVNLADPSGLSVKSWLEDNLGIDMDVAEFAGKMILSSSPVIGDINDAICAVTGYDVIWGESVGTGGRALCAAGRALAMDERGPPQAD